MLGWIPGYGEIALIACVGLLLFGKKLPSVARSIGSSFVEFKKGLSGIESIGNEIKDDIKKLPKQE